MCVCVRACAHNSRQLGALVGVGNIRNDLLNSTKKKYVKGYCTFPFTVMKSHSNVSVSQSGYKEEELQSNVLNKPFRNTEHDRQRT